MIEYSPYQSLFLLFGPFVAGCLLAGTIAYFIHTNKNKKHKRITPFIESILRRYADLMYDERYAKLTDRQLSDMLREQSLIGLWLSTEASLRMRRKESKSDTKKGDIS